MLKDKNGRNWYPKSGYSMSDTFDRILSEAKCPIAIYDTETTGVTKSSYVVQFAGLKCIPVNGIYMITDKINQLIKPPIPMPAKASEVNHITDEMLADQPMESFVVDKLQKFLADGVVAGYNHISFDNKMMDYMSMRTTGMHFAPQVNIDALVMARSLVSRNEIADGRFTLGSISSLYGISVDENESLHDALADTKVTMKVLWALARDYADSELKTEYRLQASKPEIQIVNMHRTTYSKENDYVIMNVNCAGLAGQFRYEVYDKRFVEMTGNCMSIGNMEAFVTAADVAAGGDIGKYKEDKKK